MPDLSTKALLMKAVPSNRDDLKTSMTSFSFAAFEREAARFAYSSFPVLVESFLRRPSESFARWRPLESFARWRPLESFAGWRPDSVFSDLFVAWDRRGGSRIALSGGWPFAGCPALSRFCRLLCVSRFGPFELLEAFAGETRVITPMHTTATRSSATTEAVAASAPMPIVDASWVGSTVSADSEFDSNPGRRASSIRSFTTRKDSFPIISTSLFHKDLLVIQISSFRFL